MFSKFLSDLQLLFFLSLFVYVIISSFFSQDFSRDKRSPDLFLFTIIIFLDRIRLIESISEY